MFTPVGFNEQDIVKDGLVLWYDANDKTSYPGLGTAWTDLSKGGTRGTLINGPTFNSGNGGSIVFDGVDDYVNLPTPFGGLPIFTVDTWFNPTVTYSGNTANAVITTIWYNSDVNYYIGWGGFIGAAGTIAAGIYKSGWVRAGSFVPTLNTWYNVSLSLNSGQLKMYVNGSLFSTVSTAVIPNNIYGGIYLGKRWDTDSAGNEFFTGRIPLIKIYNRALSSSEILQNFNATKGRFGL